MRASSATSAAKARNFGAVEELANIALGLSPGLFAIEVGSYDPILVELLRERASTWRGPPPAGLR